MRLHPYHTERILARPDALARIAELAGTHHERLDGSGYFKGLRAAALGGSARVLMAAHRYASLREARAHRPALGEAQAAETLVQEARSGKLDLQSVYAVLTCAGHALRPARPSGPAQQLTEREIQVLRLLARGGTLKHVARELGLAVKTVDRHVQNIYRKIDVSTRAAATLFAVENHLLDGA
jgi:DNA-binding CsgD family transcriptional regulator